MKLKKIFLSILIVMLCAYGIVIGKKGYDFIQYKKELEILNDYDANNLKKYVDYRENNNDAPFNEIIKIVNEGFAEYDYSEKLMKFIDDPNYIKANMDKYIKSEYQDDTHQTVLIINNYFDKLKGYNIDFLVEFADEKYYINKNLKRYLQYYEKYPNFSIREVIESVNCNIDYPYYTNTIKSDISMNNLILCNKYYYLPNDYVPNDLITLEKKYSSSNARLTKEAYNAFVEMHDAAINDGYNITVNGNNAYRSYDEQYKTYSYYEGIYGIDGADTCSARPGFSEHQTGLTADLGANKTDGTEFPTYSEEYEWLINNSWKYGFIFRYQENKEKYTGYQCEKWHYRYVGKDVAEYIQQNDITFDEYYQYFVADNKISESDFLKMFE